jgi:hypothetical protein
MKNAMLVAALTMTALASVLPSSASATWTEDHQHGVAGTNPLLHGEGEWRWTTGLGNISCEQVTVTLQITYGQTTGSVAGFSTNLASCSTQGELFGCTFTSSTPEGLPWLTHIGMFNTHLEVRETKVSYVLHGFFCPHKSLSLSVPLGFVLYMQPRETEKQFASHETISSFLMGTLPNQLTAEGTKKHTLGTAEGVMTLTPSSSHKYGWT